MKIETEIKIELDDGTKLCLNKDEAYSLLSKLQDELNTTPTFIDPISIPLGPRFPERSPDWEIKYGNPLTKDM